MTDWGLVGVLAYAVIVAACGYGIGYLSVKIERGQAA